MKKKKFAFSLVEALVLLTVVSIALAAITPLITRKIVNNTDPGTAPGGDSHGRYECYTDSSGTVRERMYSGSTKVYDQPASAGKCNFIPPANAANFVIYAVGGGGAGGGPGSVFQNSYIGGTKTDQLDVRNGNTFPQAVMSWTSKLGSQTQNAVTSPMPVWFNWDTLNTTINPKAFNGAVVGCGGKGGDGGDINWQSSCDFECLRNMYMGGYSFTCTNPTNSSTKNCPKTCSETVEDGYKWNICNKATVPKVECGYDCVSDSSTTWACKVTKYKTIYTSCPFHCCISGYCSGAWCSTDRTYYTGYNITCGATNKYNKAKGSCSSCLGSSCTKVTYTRTNIKYPYTNNGGSGGAAPPCARLQAKILGVTELYRSGSGGAGGNGTSFSWDIGASCNTTKTGATTDGESGGTVRIRVTQFGSTTSSVAVSKGGVGGQRCNQDPSAITLFGQDWLKFLTSLPLDPVDINIGNWDILDVQRVYNNKFTLDPNWACKALSGTKCGADGPAGIVRPASAECSGTVKGTKCGVTATYNELYTWATPSATKYLGYGEAGKPGNFEILKVTTLSQPLQITLGQGGSWGSSTSWKTEGPASNGPNGTNTIVGNLLVAKGGGGGKGSLKTNRYELCHKLDVGKESKCNIAIRTTDDIEALKEKLSGLSNIGSALVGGSDLIGGGYGKGGLGGGSQSLTEYVCDLRNVINTSPATMTVSGYGTDSAGIAARTVHTDAKVTGCPADANGYKNTYLQASAAALSGGNGAVIITW